MRQCAALEKAWSQTLTQISDSVRIDVTGQLDWSLKDSTGDPSVGQPEALSLASFSRKLPEDLHAAGVHHLGKEGGWGRHYTVSGTQRGEHMDLKKK